MAKVTKTVNLSSLARGVVCGNELALSNYGVTDVPGAVAERWRAISEVISLWEKGEFSEERVLATCKGNLSVKEYEGSEPYRDSFALDLCMQLLRMGAYIQKNGYVVKQGRIFSVNVGGDFLSGSYSMLLKHPDGVSEVVFIENKTDYSEKARKDENKPFSSAKLNAGCLLPEADIASIWTLVHKDDSSDRFMENFDEAEGKKGVLTGKQIVSLSVGREVAETFLIQKIADAEQCPNCEECRKKNLCKGDFSFRNFFHASKTEEKENGKAPEKPFVFTDEQERVIGFREGRLAVFAGPGSGKTAVLVERYCRMIEEGYSPAHIVLVVFTNKVADEIRSRIAKRLRLNTEQRKQLNVFTLNALGQKLINDNPSAFGGRFIVASSVTRREILRGILFPAKEDGSGLIALRKRFRNLYGDHYGLASLDGTMAKIENGSFEPDSMRPEDVELLMELYDKFRAKLSSMRAISYDEQILRPLQWLRENERSRQLVSSTYRYIMVDEAQDLSTEQYELVRLLAERGNLVMVGDDDQSIYRFRKGSPEHLLSFSKEADTEKVVFSENFRATELLNEGANALISGSTEERMPKEYRYLEKGVRPVLVENKSSIGFVVSGLLGEGYTPSDIAVLARTNKELLDVEKNLKGVVECNMAKDFIREDNVFLFFRAVLDVVINKDTFDAMNGYRIVKAFREVPSYSIGKELLEDEIGAFLAEAEKLFRLQVPEEALEELVLNHPELGISVPHPVLSSVREWCEEMNLKAQTLLDYMNQMVQMSDDARVDYGTDPRKVRLYTSHDSKGKEFPIVIVYDAEAYNDEDGTSEERRLLYVAMTRAKKLLFLIREGEETEYLKEITPHVEEERSA